MAEVDPHVESVIAHLPGVRLAVRAQADSRAAIARALLAQHTRTGKTEIVVDPGVTDTVVSMVNPKGLAAVMSIEFGWHDGNTHVEGLHILGKAFGV